MRPTIYIANGIVWTGIIPLGPVVAAVPPSQALLSHEQILGLIPGRNARSLDEVWKPDPPRRPFAGMSR